MHIATDGSGSSGRLPDRGRDSRRTHGDHDDGRLGRPAVPFLSGASAVRRYGTPGATLASADRGPDGLRTVVFDGTGGAVDEAIAMAALMDGGRRFGSVWRCLRLDLCTNRVSGGRQSRDPGRWTARLPFLQPRRGRHPCAHLQRDGRATGRRPRRPVWYRHGFHPVHKAGADEMARRGGCELLGRDDLAREKRPRHETRRCPAGPSPWSQGNRQGQRFVRALNLLKRAAPIVAALTPPRLSVFVRTFAMSHLFQWIDDKSPYFGFRTPRGNDHMHFGF